MLGSDAVETPPTPPKEMTPQEKAFDKAIKDNGFEILSKRSVSNIRSKDMKKRVSMDVLIFFERLLQRPLAQMHFGPSIFILARKSTKA